MSLPTFSRPDRVKDTDPRTWRAGFFAQLLPDEIAEGQRARRHRHAAAAAGLAFVAALGGLQAMKMLQVADADADLAAAQDELDEVRADVAAMGTERELLLSVADSVETTAVAMGAASDMALPSRQVAAALPDGSTVEALTIDLLTQQTEDPYDLGFTPSYATFQLSLKARTRDDVLAAVEALNTLPYVYFVNLDTFTRAEGTVGGPDSPPTAERWSATVSGRMTDDINITRTFLPDEIPGFPTLADSADPSDEKGDA